MKYFKQKLFLISLFFTFGLIFFITVSFLIKPRIVKNVPLPIQIVENIEPQSIKEETATLIFVGDIMLDRGVEAVVKKYGQGDFKFPFKKIYNELHKADIIFGNLEGPISNRGIRVGSIYSFRFDPKVIEGLIFAGFNLLSLANNHALDYGKVALEDTFLKLNEAGISYVGAGFNEKEAYSLNIKEINGIRIGFLAYTNLGPKSWKAMPAYSGIAWINKENVEEIKKEIKEAKNQTDILIVSIHAGDEYQKEPNKSQIEFYQTMIDAGVDLVVGHHPHVIQPVEKYKKGYIAYSLCNFVFDQDFSEETMKGLLLKVIVDKNRIKEVISIETKMNEYFQPEIITDTR